MIIFPLAQKAPPYHIHHESRTLTALVTEAGGVPGVRRHGPQALLRLVQRRVALLLASLRPLFRRQDPRRLGDFVGWRRGTR